MGICLRGPVLKRFREKEQFLTPNDIFLLWVPSKTKSEVRQVCEWFIQECGPKVQVWGTGRLTWAEGSVHPETHHWAGNPWKLLGVSTWLAGLSEKLYEICFKLVPLSGWQKDIYPLVPILHSRVTMQMLTPWPLGVWEALRDCHRHPELWHQWSVRVWGEEAQSH